MASAAKLEVVAAFNDPMPTGVAVSQSGRVFLCHLQWMYYQKLESFLAL